MVPPTLSYSLKHSPEVLYSYSFYIIPCWCPLLAGFCSPSHAVWTASHTQQLSSWRRQPGILGRAGCCDSLCRDQHQLLSAATRSLPGGLFRWLHQTPPHQERYIGLSDMLQYIMWVWKSKLGINHCLLFIYSRG